MCLRFGYNHSRPSAGRMDPTMALRMPPSSFPPVRGADTGKEDDMKDDSAGYFLGAGVIGMAAGGIAQ